MSRKEGKQVLAILERYLDDESKELLWSDENKAIRRYEFRDWVKELPNEQRVKTTFFVIDKAEESESYCTATTHVHQKFLCVNGPLAGERITNDDAEAADYLVYNVAGRGERETDAPSAVLVHRESLTT